MCDEGFSVANRIFLVWMISSTSSMSTAVFAVDTEEPITVNKIRDSQTWVRFSADYVRCFCNLPQCVSTGYMCKSSGGGCFSNFLDYVGPHSKDYRGRHGCIELSDKENKACGNAPDNNMNSHKKSLIFCCYHDMCNHIDSPQMKALINDTWQDDPVVDTRNLHAPVDYSNSQVWFRAATIAVPVCGAVILFLLIALAVKMLRESENRNSTTRKLRAPLYEYHMPSQNKCGWDKLDGTYDIFRKPQPQKCPYEGGELQRTQVPLLIQNEICRQSKNKNETNAKLNCIQEQSSGCTDAIKSSVILDIEKMTPNCSKSNLVNHVNLENKCLDVKYVNSAKFDHSTDD